MKRAILLLIVLFSLTTLNALAEEVTFTATTDKTANSSNHAKDTFETLEKEGISMKADNCTLGDGSVYKFYAGGYIYINSSVGNITKIVFKCTSSSINSGGPSNIEKLKTYPGTYKTSGTKGTWTGSTPAPAFRLVGIANVESITITYSPGVTVPVSAACYATLYYSSKNLKVPTGVKAYTYSVTDGKLKQNHIYNAGEVIPKKTAVVVNALEGNYLFDETTQSGYIDNDSKLFGYDTDTDIPADNNYYFYKLSYNNAGTTIGFYWDKDNGAAFRTGAHKAFLKLDKSSSAKEGYSFEDEITGISKLTPNSCCGNRYDLSGRPIGNDYRGVVIERGKKRIVR